jgi:hypothetical protein
VTGAGFTMSGATFPLTLNQGQNVTLTVNFDPTTAGAAAGAITLASDSTTNPSAVISLSGTGTAAQGTLSALSCTSGSISGAGTDACTVTLSTAAPSGGLIVNLSSSDTAVKLPATVNVPANSTGAAFSVAVASVTTAQTATLTATSGTVSKTFALTLSATPPTFILSSNSLAFGSVSVNTAATSQSVTLTSTGTAPLTISAGMVTGAGFSVSGATFPLTLNQGQSAMLTVSFDPTAAGTVNGALTLTSNSPTNPSVMLSGTGTAASGTLSALSCTSGSMSSAGTDACTVTLNAAAGSGGLIVNLSSNNPEVTLPPTVTVKNNTTSVTFSATVASVTTAQTATITATAGTVSKTFALALSANPPTFSLSSASLAFGSVTVNTAATPQSLTVISTGTAPLTISAGTVTGAGFSISGATFPLTLNQGQKAMLTVSFDPSASGLVNGAITLNSNSPTNPSVTLSGTGTAAPGTLSGLSCTNPTITGSGTDSCTVFLNAAAGSGGLIVNLSSNNSAVTLPATVTVKNNTTSATFSATVASVTTAQSATLTATAGTVSETAVISLSGPAAFQVNLTWGAPADSSTPAAAGYYIFRAIAGTTMYQQLNPQGDFVQQTMYTDTTVASGTTYDYYVESVDSNGVESVPSSIASVTVP